MSIDLSKMSIEELIEVYSKNYKGIETMTIMMNGLDSTDPRYVFNPYRVSQSYSEKRDSIWLEQYDIEKEIALRFGGDEMFLMIYHSYLTNKSKEERTGIK